ncbi:uncharacterized protein Ecym_1014 [Eremothecium cymbalariae DBVPG|uniref:Uncharacterized protein n=1 Tax=Eremothecium cymbalariae (strain CBS 270.75 / DBVPG 7215 / KCTC 17166 / NRRL Y-17582) TaxID=931890 RepID=G8JM13_ERECY|nr:hypothetical protein Ecym_1014 [Eremothecium cymbalariae DBVPG\
MALSGKRIRSDFKGPISIKKRQCLLHVPTVTLPRSSFLLTKTANRISKKIKNQNNINNSHSSNDIDDVDDDGDDDRDGETHFNAKYYDRPKFHLAQTAKLDRRLLETVSRYSDSESVNKNGQQRDQEYFAPQICSTDRNYDFFNFRRSISRNVSFSVSGARQKQIPKSDILARERCFDYILQSIDEVWGRYCNTTSTAENEVYDRLGKCANISSATPLGSPNSYFCVSYGGNNSHRRHKSELSDDDISDSGYKSEITNPTEYDTDCDYRKVSNLPQSMKLQSLKDRLVRAKNDLETNYDANSWDNCMYFWRRWDMIKYSAVEMMEEDDEDEIIESVIDELEEGRCYNDA